MAMSQISGSGYTIGSLEITVFAAFILLYAGWMSIGYNTGFGHASQAAVNAWFIKKRSRAFMLFSLGAGGSGLTVLAFGWGIANYGWRPTVLFAGIGIFLIIIPLSLVLVHKPEHVGLLPDGESPDSSPALLNVDGSATAPAIDGSNDEESSDVTEGEYDFGVIEALKTFSFWMLIVGTGSRSVAMTSVIIHQVKYLTDIRGISDMQASAALGATVTVSVVGRMIFGWLGDYIDKRYLLIGATLLQALGIFILANATSMGLVWLYAVIYGIAYGGGIPVYMAIVGDYFGRKNYATIRGFMQMFQIPATVTGPIFAGWVFDTTGNYQVAFTTFIASMFVGVFFLFLAKRPRTPEGIMPSNVGDAPVNN
jgi:MFS family permease